MTPDTDLYALRDRPFELLKAMERRGLAAAAGTLGQAVTEWSGLAFRIGRDRFVCSRDDVREVLVYPDVMTRVPGTRDWLSGLANVRGQLLPVVDLKAFLGGGQTRPGRATRVIVVNHRDVPAGLTVDELLGFRRFADEHRQEGLPPALAGCEPYLQGAYHQDGRDWLMFSLLRLVESPQFLAAGHGMGGPNTQDGTFG
jgi:twitching motility protein PilI